MNAQEQFWSGEGGDEYQRRSPGDVDANYAFFQKFFEDRRRSLGRDIRSVIELGAGVGNNLRAIREIDPTIHLTGVEINEFAYKQLCEVADTVQRCSLLAMSPFSLMAELALTKGVLIHIAPDDLPKAYDTLYRSAITYILICEYYSPKPRMIPYRGENDRLWARDFAGEILDRFGDLDLIDYGFVYHRDEFPQDDLTWFLMAKKT